MRLLCLQWKVIYNKQQSSSTGVVEMYRPIYYITCFTPVGVAAAYLKIPKMATSLLSTRITKGPQQLSPDFLPDHSRWDSVPGTPSHFPDCRPSQLRFFLEALRSVFLRLLASQIYRQYCSSTAQGQEILMSLVVSSKVVYLLLLFSAILRFASPDGPGILLYFRSGEISTILRTFVSKFRQVLVCQVLNAKDAGLVFQSAEVMQDIYNSSEPAWFKRGMSESLSKTILLYQNIPPVIMIYCNNLSAVDMFCYLSFLVTSTNVLDAEIQERTGKAETVFNSFHECATITNFGFI